MPLSREGRATIYEVPWFRAPSGLFLPSERAASAPRLAVVLGEVIDESSPIAVLREVPSFFDQMKAVLGEAALDLPRMSTARAVALMEMLGFETAAWGISVLGRWIDATPVTADAQLALAEVTFGNPLIVQAIADAMRRGEGDAFVAEQHLMALARLAVLHANPGTWDQRSEDEAPIFERLLLGMSSVTDRDFPPSGGGDIDPLFGIAVLIQNGAFNAREPLGEALARASHLFDVLPKRWGRATTATPCDLDAWAVRSTGLTVSQQLALGVAALLETGVIEREAPPVVRGSVPATWAAMTAKRLGVDREVVLDAISADREWYVERFAELEKRFSVPPDAAVAGWNRVPFEQRPFLRLADGSLLLWSPSALLAWMTEGFYYRALDAAEQDRRDAPFRHYYARLVERYAFELLTEAHPLLGFARSARVHPEQTYRRRKKEFRTPDVMVDCGPDLVFVEVFSGRLSFQSRVRGNPADIERDLTKLITKKVARLSARIDDYLDGAFEVPDSDRRAVRRIWPLLVTGSGILFSRPLWSEIETRTEGALRQAPVQPLSVFDLHDLELLCSFIEAGHSLPDLLRRKTGGPYRELDWRRVVSDDPHLRADKPFSGVDARSNRAWRQVAVDLRLVPRNPVSYGHSPLAA